MSHCYTLYKWRPSSPHVQNEILYELLLFRLVLFFSKNFLIQRFRCKREKDNILLNKICPVSRLRTISLWEGHRERDVEKIDDVYLRYLQSIRMLRFDVREWQAKRPFIITCFYWISLSSARFCPRTNFPFCLSITRLSHHLLRFLSLLSLLFIPSLVNHLNALVNSEISDLYIIRDIVIQFW